jgi:hypothetical protein
MPDPPDNPPPPPPILSLDYAKPRRRLWTTPRWLIFLFATGAILFGLLMLVAATALLVDTVLRGRRHDRAKDIFGIVMLTLIATFSAAAGFKWFADARRAPRSNDARLD